MVLDPQESASRPSPPIDSYKNCINPYNKLQNQNRSNNIEKKNSKKQKLQSPPVTSTPKQTLSQSEDQEEINNKHKQKPISTWNDIPKNWNLEDAKRALDAEKEFNNQKNTTPSLVIKFPEVDNDFIKSFSSSIQCVRFQQPQSAR